MSQRRTFKWKSRHWLGAGALLIACGMSMTSCNGYDLDERLPEGWGQSIYSYMAERDFENMTRIIDDLGYRDVLNQTGSKTLFAANDEAFERFYQNNSWGVHKYEDLTYAQKKMLLFGAMIDNSYQSQALGSTEASSSNGDPKEGQSMRRKSSLSEYDTVAKLKKKDMPENHYWARYRDRGEIVCMQDMSNVPMIHFTERQMENMRISNDDYNFLFNYKTNRQTGDVSINGKTVVEQNIRCANGFIHRVEDVVTPLQNMAEIIKSKPNTTIFNKLLERFCAPYKLSINEARRYNDLYNANVDSVYEKCFFAGYSRRNIGMVDAAEINITSPDGGPITSRLKFDPEWNSYYYDTKTGSVNEALMRDIAVMMVPSDSAMNEYWDGEGSMLRDYYGSWDNVTDEVIAKLINNNMLYSLSSSVPSKFGNILNNANDPMGVTKDAIDSVWLACNGAIYLTRRVYTPTEYVSVGYPALINESMKVVNTAIENLNYSVFLNSLNSTYSFFIPTNKAMLEYIDPVSYGQKTTKLWRFHYDPTQTEEYKRVWASVFEYDPVLRTIVDENDSTVVWDWRKGAGKVSDRLKDILESHLVVGSIDASHQYYRTRGGMTLRVLNESAGEDGMTVEGSFQVNEGSPIKVVKVYDQRKKGNGKSYIIDGEPIMGTRKTVKNILDEHDEFSEFAALLNVSGLTEKFHRAGSDGQSCGGTNISVLNNYHYTVYVPSNEAILKLQQEKKLPKASDVLIDIPEDLPEVAKASLLEQKSKDSLAIAEFVKYHIQDNSIFVNSIYSNAEYETSCLSNGQFMRLHVSKDTYKGKESIKIVDGSGATHYVMTDNEDLYNLQARETYCSGGIDPEKADQLEAVSAIVVHRIDGCLLPKK